MSDTPNVTTEHQAHKLHFIEITDAKGRRSVMDDKNGFPVVHRSLELATTALNEHRQYGADSSQEGNSFAILSLTPAESFARFGFIDGGPAPTREAPHNELDAVMASDISERVKAERANDKDHNHGRDL